MSDTSLFELMEALPQTEAEKVNWEERYAKAVMANMAAMVEAALYMYPVVILETSPARRNQVFDIAHLGLSRYIHARNMPDTLTTAIADSWIADIERARITGYLRDHETSGLVLETSSGSDDVLVSLALIARAYAYPGEDIILHPKYGLDTLRTGAPLPNPAKEGQRLVLLLHGGVISWRDHILGARPQQPPSPDGAHHVFRDLLHQTRSKALYFQF